MSATPSLAQLFGRMGGYVVRSRHDPLRYTARARRTFLEGFEQLVDPDGTLPLPERRARAEAALRARMVELAARSVAARAKRGPTKRLRDPDDAVE